MCGEEEDLNGWAGQPTLLPSSHVWSWSLAFSSKACSPVSTLFNALHPTPPTPKGTNKVYATVVDMSDNLVRKDGGPFDLRDYQEHPEQYTSIFAEKASLGGGREI